MFTKLFRWLKPAPPPAKDPTANWPQPMRGDYAVLPFDLDWFDWTDRDRAFLTVDADGTVKLHTWYAHQVGPTWTSLDYIEIGQISRPPAAWACYWMRPSWYDEMIAQPMSIDAAWEVA